MKRCLLFVSLVALSPAVLSAKPGETFPPLTPDESAAIQAALPAKPTATPKKPRKVLVFYRTEGCVHKSIPFGNEALKKLGEATGAYTAVVSDDMAMFDPENLKQFDAVIFQNTTRLAFEKPAQRQALLDFVASGKGVVGIHAATDNFPTWPEGQALIGGLFHSHPWTSGDLVAIKLDEPAHVVNKAFGRQGFWLTEEIYQIVGPYGRDKQRVLVSMDMGKPSNSRPPEKLVRKDNDFPISWIKTSGKGRVFYSSLGHNNDIFSVPQILGHFLDGIQYALGDLSADAIPSAQLSKKPEPALAPEKSATLQQKASVVQQKAAGALALGEDSLKRLADFENGQAPVVPDAILAGIRLASPEGRAKLEPKLAAMLTAPATANGAREQICRWLGWMGSDQSIPALVRLAGTKENGGYAIRALGTIPAPGANAALVKLLASSPDDLKVTVATALGVRRAASAIPALRLAAEKETPPVAASALNAIAAIGSKDALATLLEIKTGDAAARNGAIIACGSNLLAGGAKLPAAAQKALNAILDSDETFVVRIEAARLLLAADPAAAAARIEPLLKAEDFRLRLGISRALSEVVPPAALGKISWNAAPDAWAVMLHAAVEKPSSASLPLFQSALGASDPALRQIAVKGIGRLNDAAGFELLPPLLADPSPEVASAAAAALAASDFNRADAKLLVLLPTTQAPALRVVLLKILSDRQQRDVFVVAAGDALNADPALGKAAGEALANLARGGDLPVLLPLFAKVPPASRTSLQKAVARATALDRNPAAAVALLSEALAGANTDQKAELIKLLAVIDIPESADKLHTLLAAGDLDSRKQVIRALASARNKSSCPLLREAAEKGQDTSERILAVKGFIDTIPALPGRSSGDQVADYRVAWKLAERDEEKNAVRSAVAGINKPEAKKFLEEIKPTPTPSPTPALPTPPAQPAK